MSKSNCIICNHTNTKLKFKKSNVAHRQCQNCKLVFVSPLPDINQQKKFYDVEYQEGLYLVYKNAEKIRIKLNEKRFHDLSKYNIKKRILDIGCATGFFLDLAKKNGLDTYGIELSYEAYEIAKKKHDNIFNGTLEDAKFSDSQFDTITMFDVIEHVLNPDKTIKEVSRIMNKDGILAITTPDFSSSHSKIMGKHWYQINPSQHLFYFTPQTIRLLLEKHGFKIIKIEKNHKIFSIDEIINMSKHYFPNIFKIISIMKLFFPRRFLLKERFFYFGEMYVVSKKIR